VLLVIACLLVSAPALAQDVIPTAYQLRFYLDGGAAPSITFDFAKAAMVCDLPVVPPASGRLRVTDPERPGRDCEWADPGSGPILAAPVGVNYVTRLAGLANVADGYGPESTGVPFRRAAFPAAPGNFRLRP